jgi:hypothetical protein
MDGDVGDWVVFSLSILIAAGIFSGWYIASKISLAKSRMSSTWEYRREPWDEAYRIHPTSSIQVDAQKNLRCKMRWAYVLYALAIIPDKADYMVFYQHHILPRNSQENEPIIMNDSHSSETRQLPTTCCYSAAIRSYEQRHKGMISSDNAL